MATYAAVASLKPRIKVTLYYSDVLLPPLILESLQFADKELESFQVYLGSLDGSSRKRVKPFLGPITKEILEFSEEFICSMADLIFNRVEIQITIDQQKDLKQRIRSFIGSLKRIEEAIKQLTHPLQPKDGAVSSSSRVGSGGNKSKMVGLSDVYTTLKDNLVNIYNVEHICSIVGMTGIGKTTLVKEIFEDLDILEWFECRTWVQLGRKYEPEEITQAILAHVDPQAHKMLTGAGYEEMLENLKQSLKGKRWLIVLDDIWNMDQKIFEGLFPDNKNGSRILLTTTNHYIANQYRVHNHIVKMRLMNKEESWDLLCVKVFREGSCPLQLEKAGKKIAEKCDGLPLTIITVANLLSEAENNSESLWIEVAAQRKHQIFIDAYDEISKKLYPRYESIPSIYKLCFLYMGIFSRKYEITQSKLMKLWIVEELIIPSSDTLEDTAKMILHWLSYNSLVMILLTSTSSLLNEELHSIKSCRLRSAWWHFCQIEARNSSFFYVLEGYEDGLGEGIKGQSRLSIHNNVLFGIKDVYNSMEENCASTAHSLLCFGPYHQYSVPICFGLTLLQKLDALNIRYYEFPLEVLKLPMLRYLALTCNGNLPPKISKLLRLQFLIINRHLSINSHGSLSDLPMEIWDMNELMDLQVMGCDLQDLGDCFLPNLSRLSGVSNDSCTKGVFERIIELKKLGIRIELLPGTEQPLYCFDHISYLNKLESLTCVVINPEFKYEVAPPVPFSKFPSNLKKLHLSGLGYPWEEMSKVASLPNLEVLKLRCNAFSGPKWEVEEDGFPKLFMLLIEDVT